MYYKYKDKQFLIKEYVDKSKPLWIIAKENNVAYGTIHYWMTKYNIRRRNKSQCVKGNYIILTKELLEFLSGELLGDGSMIINLSTKYNIPTSGRYVHTSKYKEYLEWLSKKLSKFGVAQSGLYKYEASWNNKIYTKYNYMSKWYREFKDIRKKWYPDGKKIVPQDIKLTPTVIRQWYIGDGCLVKYKDSRAVNIQLSTDSYSIKDVEFLIKKLRNIGFVCNRRKSNNRIGIYNESVDDFLDYIGDCPKEIEKIYGYKWSKTFNK
jgi:hypothetical protein